MSVSLWFARGFSAAKAVLGEAPGMCAFAKFHNVCLQPVFGARCALVGDEFFSGMSHLGAAWATCSWVRDFSIRKHEGRPWTHCIVDRNVVDVHENLSRLSLVARAVALHSENPIVQGMNETLDLAQNFSGLVKAFHQTPEGADPEQSEVLSEKTATRLLRVNLGLKTVKVILCCVGKAEACGLLKANRVTTALAVGEAVLGVTQKLIEAAAKSAAKFEKLEV